MGVDDFWLPGDSGTDIWELDEDPELMTSLRDKATRKAKRKAKVNPKEQKPPEEDDPIQ
jgi:hypothetical protein